MQRPEPLASAFLEPKASFGCFVQHYDCLRPEDGHFCPLTLQLSGNCETRSYERYTSDPIWHTYEADFVVDADAGRRRLMETLDAQRSMCRANLSDGLVRAGLSLTARVTIA